MKVLVQVLVGMHVKTPVRTIVLMIVIRLVVMVVQMDVLKHVQVVPIIAIWDVKAMLIVHIVQDALLVAVVLHNVRTIVLPTV